MRKRMAEWMMICLLLCSLSAAGMGETAETPALGSDAAADEFFRSMEGRLAFTLPGVPTVSKEADLDRESARKLGFLGWINKIQLHGYTETGAEYQVHIADLSPAMEAMREEHPGAAEEQYQMNAMVNLAKFYLNLYDGEITKGPELGLMEAGGDTFPAMGFAYRYPDAEGVRYSAKGIMDGSRAVLIMCQLDDANNAVLADFHPVSEEKAAAFHGRSPETVSLGRMRITFPVPPEGEPEDGYAFYDVFSPDYAYMTAEYMAFPFSFMMDEDEEPDEFLEHLVSDVAEQYRQDGTMDAYTVQKEAEGVYSFRGSSRPEGYPEDYGPLVDLHCGFFTLNGAYSVSTADTEMGRAFLESIVFEEE